MMKGYKIRIYPTKEQEILIWKHFGACRFIWNYMLDLQTTRRKNNEKYLSEFDMIKLLTSLKKDAEYTWLKDVSNTSLQRTCTDLANDFRSFFKKNSGFPKFKSKKHSKTSYPICCEKFYFDKNTVQIQKLGRVKYKTDFNIFKESKFKFSNVRVSFINEKYMLSFSIECDSQTHVLTNKKMGIDLGIKELAVVAYNDEKIVFHNINKSKRLRYLKQKLKHIQKINSRKYKLLKAKTGAYGKTKNIERNIKKIRKLYKRITNIRNNYIHQTTHKLVCMLPEYIIVEDLNIKNMLKNKHLSNLIHEQCFTRFIFQLKYKSENYGINFIQANRYFPSSKICSNCGNLNRNLKLSDRTYNCLECGLKIDRDYNAAINLMRYVDLYSQATV